MQSPRADRIIHYPSDCLRLSASRCNELSECIIRMSADQLVGSSDEARHTRDSVSTGFLPVPVDSFLESAI